MIFASFLMGFSIGSNDLTQLTLGSRFGIGKLLIQRRKSCRQH
jgi:phosphoenolpyruvate synthase/pyruvate phosphate dikinase